MPSAGELLQRGAAQLKEAGIDRPWSEALLLLAWALGRSQAALLAHPELVLKPEEVRRYSLGLAQRRACKPLAYITESKSFLHWDFFVRKGVLIPRPETELLAELAAAQVKRYFPADDLLLADIGTGCGAIGLSLLLLLPGARLLAVDSSPRALETAKINARRLGVESRAFFVGGDLLAPLGPWRGNLACITANLPYIPEGEYGGLQPEVREYEPKEALVSGPDGLDHYRSLLAEAGKTLVSGGLLLVEIGDRQGERVLELFRRGGFPAPEIKKDLAGLDRIVWARKP